MKKNAFLFILLGFLAFTANAQLSAMTYNIKYANETDGADSWSKRKETITNLLKFYEPDVFGVQEALLKQIQHFKASLKGYDYIGVGREDGKQAGEYSAIFYNTNKFKVLKNNTFWLSKTPQKVSTGWDAALPRICTYALFEEKASGKKFWYFNTHFDHKGDKARRESAKLIFKKISKVNTKNYPVFLSGDFNLEPNSEGIKYLSSKMKDSRSRAKVLFGNEGTFNGFKFREPATRRIDYIFVNTKVEVLKYAVLSDNKDMRYPSDHFPVLIYAKLM